MNRCPCGTVIGSDAVRCKPCEVQRRKDERVFTPPGQTYSFNYRRKTTQAHGPLEQRIVFLRFCIVLLALKKWNWNQRDAAELLGISEPTLYRILREGCAEWSKLHPEAGRNPPLSAGSSDPRSP